MDFSNESRNLQIANYLQTLRLEQNMTLEQLSDISHVPIVHLTSIENGHFSRFDNFYLKMYLKKYTQTLDVNLEQLYAYALQQPIEDIPQPKKEEPVATVVNPDSIQHKVQSQPAVVETPVRRKPQPKHRTPKTSPLGPNYAKSKPDINLGKFLIGLFLVVLLAAIIVWLIGFFRDIGNHEDIPEDPPPVLEIPSEINLDPTDDAADETNGVEVQEPADVEPEPEDEDATIIELNEHIGTMQTFTVITTGNEIELRMEHSGANWIGGPINATHDSLLEETFVGLGNGDTLNLPVGAIDNIDAIFINGVEVPFVSNGLAGVQNFYFHIVSE